MPGGFVHLQALLQQTPTPVTTATPGPTSGFWEFVRDPAWQAFGAIIAIAVAFIIYFLQRQRRALTYQVMSASPLLNQHVSPISSKLEVRYENKPIANPYLVVVRVA